MKLLLKIIALGVTLAFLGWPFMLSLLVFFYWDSLPEGGFGNGGGK